MPKEIRKMKGKKYLALTLIFALAVSFAACGKSASDKDGKESIKDALLIAISEKDKYKAKSTNALSLAKQYNWKKLAEAFHEVLRKL